MYVIKDVLTLAAEFQWKVCKKIYIFENSARKDERGTRFSERHLSPPNASD